MFLIDILLSFRTSYLNVGNGKEITSSFEIAKRYLRSGNLILDIISTVPIDEIIANFETGISVKHIGLLGLIKVMRMIRLRKIIQFVNF